VVFYACDKLTTGALIAERKLSSPLLRSSLVMAAQKMQITKPGGYDVMQMAPGTCSDAMLDEKNAEYAGDVDRSRTVTVAVHAAGVNYADVCIRWGLYKSAKDYVGYPITPGFEFAGEVLESSHSKGPFMPGQRVFGVTLFGAYSTQVTVPEHQLFAMPHDMTMQEGAAVLATFFTAYYAFHVLAQPRAGDSVLVHSAAGGVGSTLLRLAKAADCRAVAVVGGSHKVDSALAAGADVVLDKSPGEGPGAVAHVAGCPVVRTGGVATALWGAVDRHAPAAGYKAVFDANGVSTLQGSFSALGAAGRLVVYGFHSMLPRQGGVLGAWQWLRMAWDYVWTPRFNPLEMTAANKSVCAFNLSFLFNDTATLQNAMGLFETLWERGVVQQGLTITEFPLQSAAEAHAAIESGSTTGKLVLVTPLLDSSPPPAAAAAAASSSNGSTTKRARSTGRRSKGAQ